jgi:hypothetical protein
LSGALLGILGALYTAFPLLPGEFRTGLTRGLVAGAASAVAAGVLCLLAFVALSVLVDLLQIGAQGAVTHPVVFDPGVLLGVSVFAATVATVIATTGKLANRSSVNWVKNGACIALVALSAIAVRLAYSLHNPRTVVVVAVASATCCFTCGAIVDWPIGHARPTKSFGLWTSGLSIVVVAQVLLTVGPQFLRIGLMTESLFLIAIGLFGYTFCSPPYRRPTAHIRDRDQKALLGFLRRLAIGAGLGVVWPLVWHYELPNANNEWVGIAIALIVTMAHEDSKRVMNSSLVKVIAPIDRDPTAVSSPTSVRHHFRFRSFLDRAWRAMTVATAYLGLFYGLVLYVGILTGELSRPFTGVPVLAFVVFAVVIGALALCPIAAVIGALYGAAGPTWYWVPRLSAPRR